MRELQTDLAAGLASGCTTLCRCVQLTRTDGQVLGFTDHDAAVEVDGSTFLPTDGFEASQESSALGPSAGEWDLRAALTDDRITPDDLLAGRYDGAKVETLLVDWQNPIAYERLSSGALGEVTSRDGLFQAEVRGPFAAFDRVRGRVFSARCDAELGDARCGIDLHQPTFTTQTTIDAVLEPHVFLLAAPDGQADGHFDGGTYIQGDDTPVRVRSYAVDGTTARITLWQTPITPLEVGAQVTLKAGCDKSFATCKERFSNGVNFRGFPFMPGDDFALSYPASNDGNLDGRSLQT
ncbi:MAG: DUF2163 domain-containing protein [Hyphomicrobiales bacterium]|jgi:uncharacterized phage protein (TIGR02218 family)